MKYKTKYVVLSRLVDCEDDWGIFSPMKFDTVSEARKAMQDDYNTFAETYDAEWTVDKKDHCRRKIGKDEISIDVPIWDGKNDKKSWIRARWKVVGI